jgi:hypothetical protein
MPDIHETLDERGKRYGDFTDHARIADDIIYVMSFQSNNHTQRASWGALAPMQRQALRVIADKIARILNGDPNYDDNWRDIAGYATLVLDRLADRLVPPATK